MSAENKRPASDMAASAAARLLARAVPDDYFVENTTRFARPKVVEQAKTESVVVFRAAIEWIALRTSVVVEVVAIRDIHSLPHRRLPLLGIANIGGELVTCLSLPDLLGLTASPDPATRVLIVQAPTGRVALPVAEVGGTHRFHPSELRPAPTSAGRAAAFISHLLGWSDRTIGLVEEARFFRAIETAFV